MLLNMIIVVYRKKKKLIHFVKLLEEGGFGVVEFDERVNAFWIEDLNLDWVKVKILKDKVYIEKSTNWKNLVNSRNIKNFIGYDW